MLKSFFPRSTVFYYIAGSVVDALEDYGIAKFQKEEPGRLRPGHLGDQQAISARMPEDACRTGREGSELCRRCQDSFFECTSKWQELNGTDFNGSTLKVQAGKPKRCANPASATKTVMLSASSQGVRLPKASRLLLRRWTRMLAVVHR